MIVVEAEKNIYSDSLKLSGNFLWKKTKMVSSYGPYGGIINSYFNRMATRFYAPMK